MSNVTQKLPAELTFGQEMQHRREFAEETLKWKHLEWDFKAIQALLFPLACRYLGTLCT